MRGNRKLDTIKVGTYEDAYVEENELSEILAKVENLDKSEDENDTEEMTEDNKKQEINIDDLV